jgi:hypothetical protein
MSSGYITAAERLRVMVAQSGLQLAGTDVLKINVVSSAIKRGRHIMRGSIITGKPTIA